MVSSHILTVAEHSACEPKKAAARSGWGRGLADVYLVLVEVDVPKAALLEAVDEVHLVVREPDIGSGHLIVDGAPGGGEKGGVRKKKKKE